MPEVQQLAGPGIKGLEQDPPLYHFDVTPDELDQLIGDPETFLREMGLPLLAAKSIISSRWDEIYTETGGWRPRGGGHAGGARPRACCYVTDGAMICHAH
ncbi:hypothetical protein [Streptomyces phaeochromogenes]|uniref:hypothetical protein n=1 Tax=Streptomyces phaeochromogenes TaxID=1923 RepID=UPI0033C2AC5C